MAEKITFNDKSHINPYGTREIQVWDLDINEIKQVVNANADETANNTANVKTNAIAKKTLAEIQALTPDNETLYYVLDDPTPSNNGAWGWDTPGWYKAADAVNAGAFNDTDNVTPATQKSIGDWVKALTPTVNDGAFNDTDNVFSSTQKSVADWTKNQDSALRNEENQFVQGFKMINNQLHKALETEGVTEIDALGESFDPNFHQAVMKEPNEEVDSNTVIEVFQKGYMFKDRVISPAIVKISG